MSKKWLVIFLVVVFAVAGYFGYRYWKAKNVETPSALPDVSKQVAVVKRGSLEVTVEGTGSINAAREVELSFSQGGRVAEVDVRAGQQVQKGDVLARLDTTELELKVKQAEANLESAQAQLEQLTEQPSDEDVVSAEAAYFTALKQYNDLLSSPSEEEVKIAEVSLEKAKAALQQAQAAYDRVASRPNIAMLPQSLELQNATLDYEKALAQYKQATEKPSDAEIIAARKNLEKAKAHLEDVKSGPSEEELAIKQAAVKQAEVNLALAKKNLEDATLRAPFAGTIAEVDVEPGELVGAGKAVVVLSDLSNLQATVYIDETDVGQVSVGQKAVVTLDAFPDAELTGKVSSIAVDPEVQSGVVLYPVTIDLDSPAVPVRPGMTADGQIIAKSKENVLLVPLKALHSFGNRTVVFVKRKQAEGEMAQRPSRQGGQPQGAGKRTGFASSPVFQALLEAGFRPVRVELGMVTDTQAEVVSGLSEGDVVSTASLETSGSSSSSRSNSGRSPVPGLFPGGGPR
jgi:HlyD family secretion protein